MKRFDRLVTFLIITILGMPAVAPSVRGQENVRVLRHAGNLLKSVKTTAAEKIVYIQWDETRTSSDLALMNPDGSGRDIITDIGASGASIIDIEYTPGSDYLGFVSPMYRGQTKLMFDGFLVDFDAGEWDIWTTILPPTPTETKQVTVNVYVAKAVNSLFLTAKGKTHPISFGPIGADMSFSQVINVPVNDPSCWILLYCAPGIGDLVEINTSTTNAVNMHIGTRSSGTRATVDIHPSISGRTILDSYEFWNAHAADPSSAILSSIRNRLTKEFDIIGNSQQFGFVTEPALSRDERHLAYCMGTGMMGSLMVTTPGNPTGGAEIVKGGLDSQTGLLYRIMKPAWSQDASRLTFTVMVSTMTTFDIRSDVYIVNRDGTGLQRLTQLPANMIADAPSFSLDDETIAFTLYTSSKSTFTSDEFRDAKRDIAIVPSAGGQALYLTQDGTCSDPCYFGYLSTDVEKSDTRPADIELSVCPHPVTSNSNVMVRVPSGGRFVIVLYDLLGKEVSRIYDGEVGIGMVQFSLDRARLAGGTYILSVTGEGRHHSELITVVR